MIIIKHMDYMACYRQSSRRVEPGEENRSFGFDVERASNGNGKIGFLSVGVSILSQASAVEHYHYHESKKLLGTFYL